MMFVSLVQQVYAQCENIGDETGLNLGDCLTLDGTTKVKDVYNTPAALINIIVRNFFIVAGFLLLITIIMAGFKFIQSGTKGKDEAKTMFKTALTGMIVMFVAYWILALIEYATGQDILP